MGCNYYLEKRDNSNWIIPNNSLGVNIERQIIKALQKGEADKNSSLVFDLSKCLSEEKQLHIGKSSFGWHFGLCIYPSLDIYNLKDWEKYFNDKNYKIVDEYGDEITKEEMLDCITNRRALNWDKFNSQEEYEEDSLKSLNEVDKFMSKDENESYKTYDDFLEKNHATRGKFGLLSRKSSIWDMRDDEVWKDFLPMLTTSYTSDGTYDLTSEWDFS